MTHNDSAISFRWGPLLIALDRSGRRRADAGYRRTLRALPGLRPGALPDRDQERGWSDLVAARDRWADH